MALGDVIGRLSVVLGLDTAAFETGARRAARATADTGARVEQMGSKIGGAARALIGLGAALAGSQLVQSLRQLSREGLEFGKSIEIQSKLAGAGVVEFQRAAHAARSVGVETEKLADIYKDVNDKVGDFMSTGGGEMKDFFEKIAPKVGVTAEMFRNLSGPDALQLYVSSLERAGVSQAEMTFYMESIADDATRLAPLLVNGAAGFKRLSEEADKLGIVLSEDDIRKGAEALQQLDTMNQVIAARQAKISVENAQTMLRFEEGWGKVKLGAMEAAIGVANFFQTWSDWAKRADTWVKATDDAFAEGWRKNFESARRDIALFGSTVQAVMASVIQWVERTVRGIREAMVNRLNAVWDGVRAKVDQVKGWFFGLYDAVVGNSYIPDMVDGIAYQMARLDAAMVQPARDAAEATRRVFEALQQDVGRLMDRLFPEAAQIREFQRDMQALRDGVAAGMLTEPQRAEAERRLRGQWQRDNPVIPVDPESIRDGVEAAKDPLASFALSAQELESLVEQSNRGISESFFGMADSVVRALDRVAGAFRGGSFLDKLSAVIGLAAQLGGTGLFGQRIADNINFGRIPRYASGTSSHPGGPAWVGERGPELVIPPGGSRVIPNHALRGGPQVVEIVDTTGLFRFRVDGQIMEAAPSIASAGAQGGLARARYMQSRRVGR